MNTYYPFGNDNHLSQEFEEVKSWGICAAGWQVIFES